MATKIVTKNSSTASAVPTASDLVQGELAVNVADKRLFTEDNTGTIVELGTNPSTINIDAGTIDGAVIGGNTPAAITGSTVTSTGNIVVSGTVDGRDVATDGTKLDGIEANADVTDTTNVTAAGALMDSEVANLAQVKAFDSSDYATAAQGTTADNALPKSGGAMTGAITTNSTFDGRDVSADGTKLDGIEAGATADQTAAEIKTAYESNADTNAFTDADHTKLDGIEASADVTDTANVTAAGALMDSELTSEASVKALNQGVATTDSPTFAGLTVDTDTLYVDSTNNRVGIGTSSPSANLDIESTTGNQLRIAYNSSFYWDVEREAATGDLTFTDASNGETVRFTNDGNVGIGTSSPQSDGNTTNLEVSSAFGARVLIANTDTNGRKYGFYSSNSGIFGLADYTASGTPTRMAIDSSGRVGIGTSSPSDTLSVVNVGSSGTGVQISSGTSSGDLRFKARTESYNGIVSVYDSGSNEDVRISAHSGIDTYFNSGSNVGIGTSLPVSKLDAVLGSTSRILLRERSSRAYIDSVTETNSAFDSLGINGSEILFETNGTERMRLNSSGRVGIGTSSPVARLEVHGAFPFSGTVTSLSTSVTKACARIRGSSDASTSLYFGSLGNDAEQYIQASNDSGTGADDIALNPYGGNVGIGTSSPSSPLTVSGEAKLGLIANPVRINSSASTGIVEFSSTGSGVLRTLGSVPLAIQTDSTERMRIDSSGNLLVGVTTTNITPGGYVFYTGSVDYQMIGHASGVGTGNYYIGFAYNGSTIGAIVQNGTTGIAYNTSSDQRLKENIADADDAGSKIDAIQVRQYDWKADGSHQDYGMIAQELVEVAPEAVTVPADSEEMMGVDYSKLVPMLIKEIQSLRNRVAQLEE